VAYGHGGVGLLFKAGKIVKRMKAEDWRRRWSPRPWPSPPSGRPPTGS